MKLLRDFLIVDDDERFLQVFKKSLQKRGLKVEAALNQQGMLLLLQQYRFERAVLDLKLDKENGLQLLMDVKREQKDCEVLILTAYSSIATTVKAVRLGAVNYLCKPASIDEIFQAFSFDEDEPLLDEGSLVPISVDRLQWEHIHKVLEEQQGNISATARALGMHRRTLQRKLQKYPVKR